jgi:hypothetical protein
MKKDAGFLRDSSGDEGLEMTTSEIQSPLGAGAGGGGGDKSGADGGGNLSCNIKFPEHSSTLARVYKVLSCLAPNKQFTHDLQGPCCLAGVLYMWIWVATIPIALLILGVCPILANDPGLTNPAASKILMKEIFHGCIHTHFAGNMLLLGGGFWVKADHATWLQQASINSHLTAHPKSKEHILALKQKISSALLKRAASWGLFWKCAVPALPYTLVQFTLIDTARQNVQWNFFAILFFIGPSIFIAGYSQMMFFRWLNVGVQGIFRIHELWMHLLSLSTDLNAALLVRVPYFSIKSTPGLWHWFQLRRHLLEYEFPLDYSLNSATVGTCCIGAIVFVAGSVTKLVLFDSWSFLGTVIAVTWSLASLKAIFAATAIWKEQQLHINLLKRQIVLCNAAKNHVLGQQQNQQPENMKVSAHIEFVKYLIEDIENEAAPMILGVPVKPKLFYLLLTYFATACITASAKYISGFFSR